MVVAVPPNGPAMRQSEMGVVTAQAATPIATKQTAVATGRRERLVILRISRNISILNEWVKNVQKS
jgi:hypothetical protein